MKTIFVLILLVSLANLSVAKPGILNINITMIVTSHSKDSTSTKTSFTVAGDKVVYDETYSGYRASARTPVHREYRFTEQEVANLTRIIQQKNLLRSRSFAAPADSGPPYTSYELTEEIWWQGKRSLIKVSGSMKSLNPNEKKNNRLYQEADALFEYVRAAVNLKGDSQ